MLFKIMYRETICLQVVEALNETDALNVAYTAYGLIYDLNKISVVAA